MTGVSLLSEYLFHHDILHNQYIFWQSFSGKKEKPLPLMIGKGVIHTRAFSLHCCSLVQLLRQTGLLPVGGVLVNNTLGSSLVDHGGSRGQLLFGVGRVGGYSSIELTDGSTDTALDDAIAQILLLADLHALLGGLDIRQLGSPPLRILKKPHGIISRLQTNCKHFLKIFPDTVQPGYFFPVIIPFTSAQWRLRYVLFVPMELRDGPFRYCRQAGTKQDRPCRSNRRSTLLPKFITYFRLPISSLHRARKFYSSAHNRKPNVLHIQNPRSPPDISRNLRTKS